MDDPFLRPAEILDLAIEMEHEGLGFYKACAKASLGPPVTLVFEHLIAAEQRHVRVFADMKRRLAGEALPEGHSVEVRRYIEKLIWDRVSSATDQILSTVPEIADPVEAVEIAMEFERKSIQLYPALKELLAPTESEIIETVIAEEHDHISRLMDLLHELES
ncbi:MAG: ferritin family protein [Desulfomonile tiedjei]|nr:ferritin family protein [Desulfomonile tiedjei]